MHVIREENCIMDFIQILKNLTTGYTPFNGEGNGPHLLLAILTF